MDLLKSTPFVFFLLALNYTLVVVSLVHLIFWTRYTLGQRLTWMVALWVLPVLGPTAYWLVRLRRN